MAFFPALGHGGAHDGADAEHDEGRNQSQQGELIIHAPHFVQGHQAENQSVKEHQDTITKTFLDGINIIGVKAHQVADLVNLVILLRKLAAVVKHPLAQVGSNPHSGAEKADTPQKAPNDHEHHDPDHGQADVLQQNLFGKGQGLAVYDHLPQVDPVDDQTVKLGDQQLDIVNH